jgi:hypothetical protein
MSSTDERLHTPHCRQLMQTETETTHIHEHESIRDEQAGVDTAKKDGHNRRFQITHHIVRAMHVRVWRGAGPSSVALGARGPKRPK